MKPIFWARLNFSSLTSAIMELDNHEERSKWLLSFAKALQTNQLGLNSLADEMLTESTISKEKEATRKAEWRAEKETAPKLDNANNNQDQSDKFEDIEDLSHGQTRTDVVKTDSNSISNSISNRNTERDKSLSIDFDRFWELYPKKEGKEYAKKCFVKMRKFIEIDKMLEALKSQIEVNWKYRDRQFILNPSTWLNGKRWEDDIVEPNNELKTHGRGVSEPRKNKMQEMEEWNMKILKEIEDEFNAKYPK